MIQTDILIIGAGITGTALARELSRYHVSVTVIERGADVAEGATKANSGIVHAGYDAVPGTLKAKYNVLGAAMFPGLCSRLSVPYRRCGALVVGFGEEDRSTLEGLLLRGQQNGVSGLKLISGEEAIALEPSLNPEVSCALEVETSGIVSPYELAFALADDAAANGVSFVFGQEVSSVISDQNKRWRICTVQGETVSCKTFVNCSGASGAFIHNQISADKLNMTHRRGQYYLLDRAEKLPFTRTIFQCPTAMGKGVLVSPTVHGNLLLGPNWLMCWKQPAVPGLPCPFVPILRISAGCGRTWIPMISGLARLPVVTVPLRQSGLRALGSLQPRPSRNPSPFVLRII